MAATVTVVIISPAANASLPSGTDSLTVYGTVAVPGQAPNQSTLVSLDGFSEEAGGETPFDSLTLTAMGSGTYNFAFTIPAPVIDGANTIRVDSDPSGSDEAQVTVAPTHRIATFEPSARQLRVRTPQSQTELSAIALAAGEAIHAMAVAGDCDRIFLSEPDSDLVHVADIEEEEFLATIDLPEDSRPTLLAVSHDGAVLAIALAGLDEVWLYDAATSEPIEFESNPVRLELESLPLALSFSGDDTILGIATLDGTLGRYDMDGDLAGETTGGDLPGFIASLVLSSDGDAATILGALATRVLVAVDLTGATGDLIDATDSLPAAPAVLAAGIDGRLHALTRGAGCTFQSYLTLDPATLNVAGVLLLDLGKAHSLAGTEENLYVGYADRSVISQYSLDEDQRVPILQGELAVEPGTLMEVFQ